MSGDAEQEYFVDGMVEDIITGLSRIKWLFVIARNSSFTYKGKAVDVRQVGRELACAMCWRAACARREPPAHHRAIDRGRNGRAYLGRSIRRRHRRRVRSAGQDHAEHRRKHRTQSSSATEIERAQRKRPDSLDAYDLYLRACLMASAMPEDAAIGMSYLEEALRLDPNYAAAHAYMAWRWRSVCARRLYETDAAAGVRHARAALAHGGDDATALAVASLTHSASRSRFRRRVGSDRSRGLLERLLRHRVLLRRAHTRDSGRRRDRGRFR